MKVKWQSDTPNMELKVPSEIKIEGGYPPYELPVATKEVLGGVKIDGDTINITSDGVISTQKVDLSGVATKVELEEVENKIPDTSGLATKSELATVESKIPDTSGLATQASLSNVEAKIPDISGLATKAELQTVEGSIPSEYLKNASVADNKLTITKSSGDTIEFSGGGEQAQLNYNIPPMAALTEQDKEVIKSAIKFGTGFFIDKCKVIRMLSVGSRRMFITLKPNGATDTRVLGYQVDVDADMNVTSNVFTTFINYVLVGSNSDISGDIITSDNWETYIDISADDWISTTTSDSNLYNAKQLWVIGISGSSYYEGIFRFDYSAATTILGDCTSTTFMLDDTFSFSYNGTSISASNGIILAVFYKT